ncbi:nitroreductase family protein [Parasporobacterium paucivorans]|uniref:Nitroreductase n=1 Tax=Parasporobacterium paucivorans DSM 15970 TaxID=1122934 RepID=A0A1M6JZU6_9FIRM|nr:nitroreductase family protein [Parasporobacterium paucivorans]SHJ52178.1 Nitroreductase [Parasporobacterium paucivorans DSM 15970]
MEFQKVIESRRSVRNYDPAKKVDKATVEELVEAAILAPSWKNAQASRYYCILSEEALSRFRQECLPAFNANNVAQAPALIVTTFVKNRSGFERSGEQVNELGNGWGLYDLGLQNENLLLKAKDMGLDTLVIGIRDADKICEMLSINEDETVVSVIGLGYAIQEPGMPKRKNAGEILKFF